MENESVTQDFTKKTWKEDLTLVVEGKRLYAAKNILAIVSPVFEAMFSRPFSEKEKEEVDLPGKKYSSFLQFLKCVYPNTEKEQTISDKNVFEVLPLADEYQVKFLKDKCERYLQKYISKKDTALVDLLKCLSVAEHYNLNKLKEVCKSKIIQKQPEDVASVDFDPVCKDSMFEVMKKIVLKQKDELELVKMYIHEDTDKEISPLAYVNFRNARGTVLTFAVTNVSSKQTTKSPAIDLWGFKFSALIKYTTANFGFFLNVDPPENTGVWSCRVKARLILKSLQHNGDMSRTIDHTFTPEEYDWGYSSYLKVSEVFDPDLGFISDNKIQIAIVILANEPEIERTR